MKTFDGIKYDFHNECDLVATSSPSFENGKGLDLHVRTTLNGQYAYTSAAVLKIGADRLELQVIETAPYGLNLYINEVAVMGALPPTFAGYPLTMDGMWYNVWLNDHETISFASPLGMMKVEVNAILPGASGLVGTTGVPGIIGRDGLPATPEEMGTEWQVGVGAGDHPPMFLLPRAHTYPAACILPPASSARRRLGEDAARRRVAEEACSKVTDPEEMDDCIYDVIQTGDPGMAADYIE